MTSPLPQSPPETSSVVTLTPSYALPLGLLGVGLGVMLLNLWTGFGVLVFALFLTFQAIAIRLVFTETALEVYRRNQRLRCFPYQEWAQWRIFWPQLPILFYFREVNSIHFLPIIFHYPTLRQTLESRVPLGDSAPD